MHTYVGALIHETNAFSPVPTARDSYRGAILGYRELLAAARAAGLDVIEGLAFRAAPSAPTRRADYEALRDQLVADIAADGAVKLVLLALHGAQVAEGYPDCEGDTLQALRAAIGDDVVIGVLLDLHAAVSPAMLEHADLVLSIKEYPHTDYPETARQLAELAAATARGEIVPCTAFVPLPLFTLWHTPAQPCRAVVERARDLEREGAVLHLSLVHGFPWSDVPDAGAAVLAITDRDDAEACRQARAFARALWEIRAADIGHYRSVEACLAELEVDRAGPVVIADGSDNPGAGCGGDATWLLRALLDRGVQGAAVAMLVDPQAAEAASSAGPGATLALSLGGRSGALAGEPVVGDFQVISVCEAATIDAMPGSPPIEDVSLVRLRIAGVDVVVGGLREQVFGPRVFTEVGIDPSLCRVLVVKSAQHFYNAFEPLASLVLYADAPGTRSVDFSRLPFRQRRKPLWPLEPVTADDIPAPRVFAARAFRPA